MARSEPSARTVRIALTDEIPVRQKEKIIERVLIGMRVDDRYKSFATLIVSCMMIFAGVELFY